MRRITLALVAAGALALIGGAGATDDGVWLYPVSHGTATIAAWKAQQGEQDDQGSAGQALLLEKDAFAGDNSAAAHVIGLEGLPVQVLGLAFEYRAKDGICTITDPRWALFVQGRSGREYEISLGCKTAPASPGAEGGWIRRSFSQAFIRAEVFRKGRDDALFGRIEGLRSSSIDRSGTSMSTTSSSKPRLGRTAGPTRATTEEPILRVACPRSAQVRQPCSQSLQRPTSS